MASPRGPGTPTSNGGQPAPTTPTGPPPTEPPYDPAFLQYYYDPAYYQYYYPQYYQHYSHYQQLSATQAPPLQNGLPCRSLYVGNLSDKITEGLLYEIFSSVGPVESCKICKDKTSGISAGYGFVDYYNPQIAAVALEQFNGRQIYGSEIKVNWASNASGQKEDTTGHFHIFVGDLSPEIDDKALFNAFSAFGSISDARRVMWDPNKPGHTRGYGFVAYRKKEDAQRALTEMNGEWLGGRAIRCNWANQKGEKIDDQISNFGKALQQTNGMEYAAVLTQASLNNTTVYVGNVNQDITQIHLQNSFNEYGAIEEIKLQPEKGFAFVRYQTHESAARAICGVHLKVVAGRTLKCSWGREKEALPPPPPGLPPMMGFQQYF